jgi:hypothetical protein
VALDVKWVHLICKNSQLHARKICISVAVFCRSCWHLLDYYVTRYWSSCYYLIRSVTAINITQQLLTAAILMNQLLTIALQLSTVLCRSSCWQLVGPCCLWPPASWWRSLPCGPQYHILSKIFIFKNSVVELKSKFASGFLTGTLPGISKLPLSLSVFSHN